MNKHQEVLAIVLAGGKGERLFPLSKERTKPSVPFGGKYRIIDFALSNFVNSGIYSLYVLVQYKSQSLIEHIRTTWRTPGIVPQHFITVVPPQMRRQDIKEWYRGTADSVYQNINLIYDFNPRYVAIFGGDHVYRMNIQQMIEFHIKKKAKLTVAVDRVRSYEARKFGVVEVDDSLKILRFREKPLLHGRKAILASMGNYIFDAELLISLLEELLPAQSSYDFGKDIIPFVVKKKERIFAYDTSLNKIPGIKRYEEKFYWRDVGTIESYWQANMDLVGIHPKLDLNNNLWPIHAAQYAVPPAYVMGSSLENTLVCEGVNIKEAKLSHSILGRSVHIEPSVEIENSIVMDFTRIGRGAKIRNAIIDRFNVIPKHSLVGIDLAQDKKKYHVDDSGIVVIPRGPRKLSDSPVFF